MPEQTPTVFLADKGYDTDAIHTDLASRSIKPAIPGRSNRRLRIYHDREIYKQRNQIERFFGRLKNQPGHRHTLRPTRRKLPILVHIADARYWLKFVRRLAIRRPRTVGPALSAKLSRDRPIFMRRETCVIDSKR